MTEPTIGDQVVQLLESAEEEVLLVAPFMKRGAVERAVGGVAPEVRVRCFTRWRPDEVAAGVSDLEVADLMEQLASANLFLVADLHGKLYCSETVCLVTSANLTQTALGWRSPTNLEFGVLLPRNHPSIISFEEALQRFAVEATPKIRVAVEAAAAELLSERTTDYSPSRPAADTSHGVVSLSTWVPTCLVPSRLYGLYQGWDVHVSRAAAEDGFRDLEALGLPNGLTEEMFDSWIRSLLLQHKALSSIIQKAKQNSIASDDVESCFDGMLGLHLETTEEAFRISSTWLAHFFRESVEVRLEEGREVLSPTT